MKKIFACALAAVLLSASQAWAWADHYAITTAALKPVSALSGASVPYTDFASMAHDLGYANANDFNTQVLIAKSYVFAPKLGEETGKAVPVLDVLSKYSDEPDWGMDQHLFGEYPQLWDPAYSMMGGQEGFPSQSFRHMYWGKMELLHPVKTFKLPLGKEFKPMGEAPGRAALFIQLAREAQAKGHPYWAVRFVADALHYLEDCSQPYHTVQTPTKKFLLFPLFSKYGHGFSQYVAQMTNIVSYYHYSFEDYVSESMVGAMNGDGNIPGNQFIPDLESMETGPSDLSYRDRDVANLVRQMARLGIGQASAAGRASIKFFPKIKEDFLVMDPRFEDHKLGLPFAPDHTTGFEDDAWWAETKTAGSQDSQPRRAYFEVVRKMFGPLGYAVRQVVGAELGWVSK